MNHDGLFKVIPYKEEELDALLFSANRELTPLSIIRKKSHYTFFKEFLGEKDGLHARFVVREDEYISRDYLSDFNSYYSTCFYEYKKKCVRLHFFTFHNYNLEDFKKQLYDSLIEGAKKNREHEKFWDENYLGYTVIKPIPQRFIGFTLLKHYNFKKDAPHYLENRDYWGIKRYSIHLFGNEISMQSLAFQEQDRNVAACATISVWSMLQRAAEDYFVILKSPSEITRDAGLTGHSGNRQFPNSGLSVPAMCNAISKNGMVTDVRSFSDYPNNFDFNTYLRKLIYAYAPIKIPLILVFNVPDENDVMNGHAVTICGHKYEEKEEEPPGLLIAIKEKLFKGQDKLSLQWRAQNISKFYAHDDQWGPYTRMVFSGVDKLECPWSIYHSRKTPCEPKALIIPVYPKIRISYDIMETVAIQLHELINAPLKNELKGKIFWEIRIMLGEDLKHSIQNSDLLDDKNQDDRHLQLKVLSKPLPRYIWSVHLFIDKNEIANFLFDATGLVDSSLLLHVIFYYPKLRDNLIVYLEELIANNLTANLSEIFVQDIPALINKLKEF